MLTLVLFLTTILESILSFNGFVYGVENFIGSELKFLTLFIDLLLLFFILIFKFI